MMKYIIQSCTVRFSDPFLSIRVREISDALRIPILPKSEQVKREKSVLGHNDEVREKATASLNHANLTVCHAN